MTDRRSPPILYSFRRCPYAMRARMALHIAGIAVETREVVLRDKPPEMLEASPKGTVPVLVLQDANVLEESIAIMRWALAQNDPEGWLKRDDSALVAIIDGPFKHHLDRYKYDSRYEDVNSGEHRAAGGDVLQELDRRLTRSSNLSGDRRGLTDIATFPFVRQFANHDREWFGAQPWPHLQRWLEGHLASDLFADIMVKREQWRGVDH